MRPFPEIIEWGCVLVYDQHILSTIHAFIHPKLNDISEFCTSLTGVTRELLRTKGCSLDNVIEEFTVWVDKVSLDYDISDNNIRTCTFGAWDLTKLVPRQLNYWEISIPPC